jgi:hypothetical protein
MIRGVLLEPALHDDDDTPQSEAHEWKSVGRLDCLGGGKLLWLQPVSGFPYRPAS